MQTEKKIKQSKNNDLSILQLRVRHLNSVKEFPQVIKNGEKHVVHRVKIRDLPFQNTGRNL